MASNLACSIFLHAGARPWPAYCTLAVTSRRPTAEVASRRLTSCHNPYLRWFWRSLVAEQTTHHKSSCSHLGHVCPPLYVLRNTIGKLDYVVIMVALWIRAGHYIFILWFVSIFCLLFPRLISAAADWMSTILLHMAWPLCKFRMQVWNVLQAARWKYRTQKWRKKSPSAHHRTTLSGYIFATKAHMYNRKKRVKHQYLLRCSHNMVNFGPLVAEIGPV